MADLRAPGWHRVAACADVDDPGIFFADTPVLVERAKAVCARCEVLSACLSDAVARGEEWGVFGGQDAAERLAPTLMVVADPGPPPHVVSRGCYVTNHCQDPGCRQANTAYIASLRARTVVTTPSRLVAGEQLEIGDVA